VIKEGKFGVQETVALTTITITSNVFFSSPGVLARFVGPAAWYVTLISAAVGIIGFTFIYLLLKRFQGKDIIEIFELSLGKIIGSIFSAILAAWLVFYVSVRLREFAEVLIVYVLPLSPLEFIMLIFMTVITILCFLGLEPIARFAKLVAYVLLFGLIVVLVLSFQNYEFHHLFPILGNGIGSTIINGARRSSPYGEVIILAVVAGSLQGTSHIKKSGYISLVLSGLLISACLLGITLAFPYYVAQEMTSPMYELTVLIDYGRFYSRLDAIFLFIWIISTMIAVSILFYCSVSTYCKMFRIQKIRPVILPFSIIVFCAAVAPDDITSVILGLVQQIREYGWIVFFVLPLIALIVAKIRKKGANSNV
jgi:spore germination protein KB